MENDNKRNFILFVIFENGTMGKRFLWGKDDSCF